MSESISDPTDAEREWLESNIELANDIASEFGIESRPLTMPDLDTIWARWMGGETLGIDDPNHFINALGLALGSHLVQRLGLEWKVIEDEHGAEMALYGAVGEVRIYPANLVAKRFEDRTQQFFVEVSDALEDQVLKMREQWSERRPN